MQQTLTALNRLACAQSKLSRRLNHTDNQHRAPKSHNAHGHIRLTSPLLRQLDETQRRKNERKCACACSAKQLKHNAQIAHHLHHRQAALLRDDGEASAAGGREPS